MLMHHAGCCGPATIYTTSATASSNPWLPNQSKVKYIQKQCLYPVTSSYDYSLLNYEAQNYTAVIAEIKFFYIYTVRPHCASKIGVR